MPPTVSWDETAPAGTEDISLGDDRLRELKTQFREIFAIDHYMGSSGSNVDWGRHNRVTFQVQEAEPTYADNVFILYARDVSAKAELHMLDEDGNIMQLTSGGDFIGGMVGEIRMWSGTVANIPTGWELVTEANNRFILGTDGVTGQAIGNTGGASEHTHTINPHAHTAPSHVHTMIHTHPVTQKTTNTSLVTYSTALGTGFLWTTAGALETGYTQIAHNHTISAFDTGNGSYETTSGAGYEATTFEALTTNGTVHTPPFYALCYIRKT